MFTVEAVLNRKRPHFLLRPIGRERGGGGEVTVSGIFTIIMKETNLSEIRVANAASLALILHERAEPSLLFLRARIAMILQILRTA